MQQKRFLPILILPLLVLSCVTPKFQTPSGQPADPFLSKIAVGTRVVAETDNALQKDVEAMFRAGTLDAAETRSLTLLVKQIADANEIANKAAGAGGADAKSKIIAALQSIVTSIRANPAVLGIKNPQSKSTVQIALTTISGSLTTILAIIQ